MPTPKEISSPNATPPGWTVPPDFHRLRMDAWDGVPDFTPHPDLHWCMFWFNLLRNLVEGGTTPTIRASDDTIRELLARARPILDVCPTGFPLSPGDIRRHTRNYHRRFNHRHHLFGEYVQALEGGGERVLLLHFDFVSTYVLYVYEEDCHRDLFPGWPVTYVDYLANPELPQRKDPWDEEKLSEADQALWREAEKARVKAMAMEVQSFMEDLA